jgi:hypothetical protein
MARVVLGVGTSHAPQLVTTVEEWSLRVAADRANPAQYLRGTAYSYDQLIGLRGTAAFADTIRPERQHANHERNDRALDRLAARLAAEKIDVAVIIGNDQNECFSAENVAAFAVYRGETFENIPKTPEQIAALPPGIAPTAIGYCPPQTAVYRGVPDLATHVIEALIESGFDVGQSTRLPAGPQGSNSIQHAFGFVYRRIMRDAVIPNVPVFVNTHYPPNSPTPARCVAFGAALARAVASWPTDARVALIASGGLSHYVIDEEFDRSVLQAMARNDVDTLAKVEENWLKAGTAELKNWLPLAGAMEALGMSMELIDYVPCYRSEAGTGTAMAFATWS